LLERLTLPLEWKIESDISYVSVDEGFSVMAFSKVFEFSSFGKKSDDKIRQMATLHPRAQLKLQNLT